MITNLRPVGLLLCLVATTLLGATRAFAQSEYKSLTGKGPDVAGPFGNLDEATRHFATLKAADVEHERVVLLVDGETESKEWALSAGAELWCNGWWCRLDQFAVGDRVWVWFEKDHDKQPVRVALIADELSEQDLYEPFQIKAVDLSRATMTLESVRGKKSTERTVQLANTEIYRADIKAPHDSLRVGETVYLQTTGDNARLILDADAFEKRRATQKADLRQRWEDEGLPGTVIFLYPELGQVELMLDHESMQWGRSLKIDDKLSLQADERIAVVVRQIRPWRERTQVLLAADSTMPSLSVGQRVHLRFDAIPIDVDDDNTPIGLDKPRSKPERVEWLMSSIYCTCMMNDVCAGHVYTLAGCDAGPGHTCGLARDTRQEIAAAIDKGLTDREIFEKLLKERGPKLLRPHMLP